MCCGHCIHFLSVWCMHLYVFMCVCLYICEDPCAREDNRSALVSSLIAFHIIFFQAGSLTECGTCWFFETSWPARLSGPLVFHLHHPKHRGHSWFSVSLCRQNLSWSPLGGKRENLSGLFPRSMWSWTPWHITVHSNDNGCALPMHSPAPPNPTAKSPFIFILQLAFPGQHSSLYWLPSLFPDR